jgi:hypothetical protein
MTDIKNADEPEATRRFQRKAVLVGNSNYVDSRIDPLTAPKSDIEQLMDVLADPEIGGFDVVPKFDIEVDDFRLAISNLFEDAEEDDLLLLYFAGHGIRDKRGRLYLAVKKTQVDRLSATALPAQYVMEEMGKSASRRKVLILDCCHAGAILEDGTLRARKAPYDAALIRDTFLPTGTGTYILAASQSGQSAFEEIDPATDSAKSIYTGLIVDAIRTGEAAPDSEDITVAALHEYVRDHRNSREKITEPELAVFNQGDNLVLCRNPNVRRPLDTQLLAQLAGGSVPERYFALDQLAEILDAGDPHRAGLVIKEFTARLAKEEHFKLREKLQASLERYRSRPTLPDQEKPDAVSTANFKVLSPAFPESSNASASDGVEVDEAITRQNLSWFSWYLKASWRKKAVLAVLLYAAVGYGWFVYRNAVAEQPWPYELTMSNLVNLALLQKPVAQDDTVEALANGRWRAFLMTEDDCVRAQRIAGLIRTDLGRRVDLMRFSKAEPYKLVIDVGSEKQLAEGIVDEARELGRRESGREYGDEAPDEAMRARMALAGLVSAFPDENPGDYADEQCLSEDQRADLSLPRLIAEFDGPNRNENSNKIVDLYKKTTNQQARLRILNFLFFSAISKYSPSHVLNLYVVRTLSLLRPCLENDNVTNGPYGDASSLLAELETSAHMSDPHFARYRQDAEDRICQPADAGVVIISAEAKKLFAITADPSDLITLQRALCVPSEEFGTVGPRTIAAYSIFETYVQNSPSMTKDDKVSNQNEFARAIKFGDCDRTRFKNIFEAEQLSTPNEVAVLADEMKMFGVPGFADLGTGKPDLGSMRANIAAANAFFQIDNPDGAGSDEVTPELFAKMKLPVRQR